MGNLMASLLASANAMRTFERGMGVVENNVTNVSTPGYAKQRLTLLAQPFQIETGLPGGVTLDEAQSLRSEYAERTVRQYVGSQGRLLAAGHRPRRVEMLFDATGESGIPGALSDFFQSISSWSVSPNDQVARQSVIDQQGVVAQSFNQTAAGLMQASADMNSQATSVVGNINRLVGQILDYNKQSAPMPPVQTMQDWMPPSTPRSNSWLNTRISPPSRRTTIPTRCSSADRP
jgi:flagellar hook-associated protein 1 FlgK